jgi:ABC-type oligopeptide transport system ATPase subunit
MEWTALMPLLEVSHLVKHFVRKQGLWRPPSVVKAVDDVSFSIDEGEMFGLVGESGSGKSTTGRCILRLIEPSSGEVRFRGENVLQFPRSRMRLAGATCRSCFRTLTRRSTANASRRHRRRAARHP